jgi:hypothetical protein
MEATTGSSSDAEQTTRPLVAPAGDRCVACGAALASDQRYCLACGERRGKARFALAGGAAPAPPAVTPGRDRRRPRLSSGAALIAGVGTLLLALGVGVLIGRTNDNTPVANRNAPVVVTVPAGGAATPAAASSAATGSSGSKNTGPSKASKVVVTKQVATKASAAASKVLGGKVNTPPTVTVGQKGHGAGYSKGHFTGQFFGP